MHFRLGPFVFFVWEGIYRCVYSAMDDMIPASTTGLGGVAVIEWRFAAKAFFSCRCPRSVFNTMESYRDLPASIPYE